MEQVPELPIYGFSPDLSGLLSLIVIVVLPLLVGLVTKSSTPAGVKAVLLLLGAAINSIVVAWSDSLSAGTEFLLVPVLYTTLINFGIAVAVHFGLWKPVGASAGMQAIGPHDSNPPARRL